MKYLTKLLSLLCVLFFYSSCTNQEVKEELNPSLVLWYDKPAQNWSEALPVGNGRLGAMIYGGIEKETIQFNEETLWSGQPHDYANQGAHKIFQQIRELLWEGKQDEATALGNAEFMSQPFGQLCYQPFGNVLLDFPGHEQANNFKRQLNLKNAVSKVSYQVGELKYTREIIASAPDQAILVQLRASEKGSLSFGVSMDSPHEQYTVRVEGDEVIVTGKANDYGKELGRDGKPYPKSKLSFEARLKVISNGELASDGKKITVRNADEATLQLVAATSFVNYNDISASPEKRCKDYLKALTGKSYKKIRKAHLEDYQELFGRVQIDLGSSEISKRPSDHRLATFIEDEDPSMVSLLYQYGRYLLISSSRQGTQPANLQGIWNDRMMPPWDSKYTININTEMNYWLAELTNLSELSEPLIQMVEDISETGKNVAKEHYGLNGWVTHHNTDIWRGAAPINNANHGLWPMGGAWLSQHLWWHYQFTGDKEYLKERAYPVLKEASRFFAEYLVPDPKKPEWLVSGPSNSPELGGLVMAPTMDHQIIRNLFANTIEAAQLLGVDAEFVEMLKEKRAKIAPNLIGQYGQLQEWLVDADDPNSKHRHVSHLWGLHPGNEIHPLTTPDLAEACKVTLSHRGDGGTGWSRAWKINFWARLLDGNHSFLLLKNLMVPAYSEETNYKEKGGLYNNLFDAHPPFQIDGNFGATSGVTEMLLQSHLRNNKGDFYLDILPALPDALATGSITGIKARGGFELALEWENGVISSIIVKSLLGNKLLLRYKGKLIETETSAGESYSYAFADFN